MTDGQTLAQRAPAAGAALESGTDLPAVPPAFILNAV